MIRYQGDQTYKDRSLRLSYETISTYCKNIGAETETCDNAKKRYYQFCIVNDKSKKRIFRGASRLYLIWAIIYLECLDSDTRLAVSCFDYRILEYVKIYEDIMNTEADV